MTDIAGLREFLGRIVRAEWIKWAQEQPNPKPSWLQPWEDLTEPEREVDRRIGMAIRNITENALLAAQAENERLREALRGLAVNSAAHDTEAIERDAARYRWLRAEGDRRWWTYWALGYRDGIDEERDVGVEELDAAIDRAMAEGDHP